MSYRLVAVLSLWALILAGCAPQTTDPKSRFLRGDPCKPPCFEGITPGETSLAEAEALLGDSDHIGTEHAAFQLYDDIPLLEWSYPDSEWVGRANNGFDGDESIAVRAISVSGPDLCLKDIIRVYGEPDKFFLTAYQAAGWVLVIWDDPQMLYSSDLDGSSSVDEKPDGPIESEICGGAAEFIASDANKTDFPSLGLFVDHTNSDPNQLDKHFVEWQGMDYDYGEGEFEMPINP